MNKTIEELAIESGYVDRGNNHTAYANFNHELFAKLIINECIKVVDQHHGSTKLVRPFEPLPYQEIVWMIEEHFGINDE